MCSGHIETQGARIAGVSVPTLPNHVSTFRLGAVTEPQATPSRSLFLYIYLGGIIVCHGAVINKTKCAFDTQQVVIS